MKKKQDIQIIGGRAQWSKHAVKLIFKDLQSLGLCASIECSYPIRRISIYFKSNEDMNFYKLSGEFKEFREDVFAFIGQVKFCVDNQLEEKKHVNRKN